MSRARCLPAGARSNGSAFLLRGYDANRDSATQAHPASSKCLLDGICRTADGLRHVWKGTMTPPAEGSQFLRPFVAVHSSLIYVGN